MSFLYKISTLQIFTLILGFSCSDTNGASWKITYPSPDVDSDIMTTYPVELLTLALDQTGVNYELNPSSNQLTKIKALNRLEDNREVNLVWGMTSIQREENLHPIRIPLFKGLIGWRLLLIRDDMSERFKYIQSLEHLIKLSPVQGRDWPDTKILRSNGFDVIVNQGQGNLLNMLATAQGDFYPRSLAEIWHELESLEGTKGLSVQPTLGIRYPAAVYFFVNKNNSPLAHLIEVGLEKAIKNGNFEEMFLKTFQGYIERADLQNRNFYQLENTFLPKDTPLQRKELWFPQKHK
ncbi:amino acid ABC transporter substrate-binding protein [uncultured Paraglaciecola sp.]|uniref:amino acid ABC transporter substrate-binding protein n=1 Tax=uncultured Paraglaciecola sp. TaxID=1765024 RepID=UPI0025967280|nr:amino acid ABC transporter substrate-binding protein [uncultured Paraglaciecola sp.]